MSARQPGGYATAHANKAQKLFDHAMLDQKVKDAAAFEVADFDKFTAAFKKASEFERIAEENIQTRATAAREEELAKQKQEAAEAEAAAKAAAAEAAARGAGQENGGEGGRPAVAAGTGTNGTLGLTPSPSIATQHFSLTSSDISNIDEVPDSPQTRADDLTVEELLRPSAKFARTANTSMEE